MSQERNPESEIAKRLKQIATYLDATCQDEYLSNLYLILIGSRTKRGTLLRAFKRMEVIRKLILHRREVFSKKGILAPDISQRIYDERSRTKLKCLMRILRAKQTALLLEQRLREVRETLSKVTSEP